MGLSVGDGRRFYTNLYSYLKYDLSLVDNAHNFSLMVGYNQESEKYETLNAYRKDFAFDLPVLNAGGTADWSNSGGEEEWAIQSLFGRFNYDFKERYLFEANMRYDGTSRISDENRWGVFPSFSVAWRATEEEFIKNLNLNWLNNFKLRGSWGQLGNQNIGLYPYQAMISGVDDYPFTKTSDGVIIGYQQTAYANRNIKWETTTITDIGFDLQVFDGLSVTFDWYKKTTDDILRSSQVSSLLGLSAPTVNNGSVENKGIEVALNYANMVKGGTFRGFRYNAGVYFDRSRNKLTEFGAEEIGSYSIKREDYLTEEESSPGSFRVLMNLPEGVGTIGQSGSFRLSVQSELYNCCISIDALHTDENQRNFVYVLGERSGILGKELTAEKLMVEVLDKNNRYAALQSGALDGNTKVINAADRDFAEGDPVRMKE